MLVTCKHADGSTETDEHVVEATISFPSHFTGHSKTYAVRVYKRWNEELQAHTMDIDLTYPNDITLPLESITLEREGHV